LFLSEWGGSEEEGRGREEGEREDATCGRWEWLVRGWWYEWSGVGTGQDARTSEGHDFGGDDGGFT